MSNAAARHPPIRGAVVARIGLVGGVNRPVILAAIVRTSSGLFLCHGGDSVENLEGDATRYVRGAGRTWALDPEQLRRLDDGRLRRRPPLVEAGDIQAIPHGPSRIRHTSRPL